MILTNKDFKVLEDNNITEDELDNLKNKKIFSKKNKWYWVLKENKSLEESIILAKSNIPGTVEYFNIKKGYSKEEAIIASDKFKKEYIVRSEKNFIKKHGEEDGKRLWNEYRKKLQ